MAELQKTLGTLFLTNIVVTSLLRLTVPIITEAVNRHENYRGEDGQTLLDIPEVERDFMLAEFDDLSGVFNKYSADALQFGYLTMFITAYPLASLMCLVQNFISIRVDAFTLCNLYRRPIPRRAQDIGRFQTVFETLGFAAVIVNSALVAFTGNYCKQYLPETRVWIFVGMSTLLTFIKQAVMFFVPDIEGDVKIQLQRQDFIISKLIDDRPDDNSWKDKTKKDKSDYILDPSSIVVDQNDLNPL